jgi:hypothetical protein
MAFAGPFVGVLVSIYFRRWIRDQIERLAMKRPKIIYAIMIPFGIVIAMFLFGVLPYQLWEALQTGVIEDTDRWKPDLVYTRADDPAAFWLIVGGKLFVLVVAYAFLLGMGWFMWTARSSANPYHKKFFKPHPPMELTQDDAEKYRRMVDPRDFQ